MPGRQATQRVHRTHTHTRARLVCCFPSDNFRDVTALFYDRVNFEFSSQVDATRRACVYVYYAILLRYYYSSFAFRVAHTHITHAYTLCDKLKPRMCAANVCVLFGEPKIQLEPLFFRRLHVAVSFYLSHTSMSTFLYIISVSLSLIFFSFSGGFLFARYIHMCSQSRLFVSRSVFRATFVCFYRRRRRRCSSCLSSTTLPAIDGDIGIGWCRVGSWHATPIYVYTNTYLVFLFTYLYIYLSTTLGRCVCVCLQREFFVYFIQWNFV